MGEIQFDEWIQMTTLEDRFRSLFEFAKLVGREIQNLSSRISSLESLSKKLSYEEDGSGDWDSITVQEHYYIENNPAKHKPKINKSKNKKKRTRVRKVNTIDKSSKKY